MAAWVNYPLSDAAGWRLDLAIRELQSAFLEKTRYQNDSATMYWPACVTAWATFTIASVSSDGLEVVATPDPAWDVDRWHHFTLEDSPWLPFDYDLAIDIGAADDPSKVDRFPINSNTSDTLTLGRPVTDAVTQNIFPSLGALTGKKGYIIPQSFIGPELTSVFPFWHERRPPVPNATELWQGSTDNTAATNSSVKVNFIATDRGWSLNEWQGKWLFGRDGSSRPKRVQISGNTASDAGSATISFAPQSFTFVGDVVIMAHSSDRCVVGTAKWNPNVWYTGARDILRTFSALDGVVDDKSYARILQPYQDREEAEPHNCAETTTPAFYIDVRIDYQNECGDADKHFSPDFFWSIGGLQAGLEGLCIFWCEDRSYANAGDIHSFTTAGMFHAASIHQFDTTAVAVDHISYTDVTFSIQTPGYSPFDMYWEILDHRERPVASGLEFDMVAGSFNQVVSALLTGRTLKLRYSWGWDRKFAKRFRSPRDQIIWFPEPNDEDELVDPPTSQYPGYFTRIPASTRLSQFDRYGFIAEDGAFFQSGDRAIYWGDNVYDGSIAGYATEASPVPDPLEPYVAHAAILRHSASIQASIDEDLSFDVASGGDNWLIASGVDWWEPHWHGTQGSMPGNTSTATGGSATTLIDTTKIDDVFWQRMAGVPLIVKFESGANMGRRVPASSIDPSTGVVTFASGYNLAPIAAGDVYSIPWPKSYEVDCHATAKLVLTDPNGAEHTTTIRHNDDASLHFNALSGFVVGVGWKGRIVPLRPGATCRWDGSKWEEVTRATSAEPDYILRNGKVRKGDQINSTLLNQMYLCFKQLTARWFSGGWTANGTDNVYTHIPDILEQQIFDDDDDPRSYDDAWGLGWSDPGGWPPIPGVLGFFQHYWVESSVVFSLDNTPPGQHTTSAAYQGGSSPDSGTVYAHGDARVSAFPKGTGLPTVYPSEATFYAMGAFNVADDDDGDTVSGGGGGPLLWNHNRYDPHASGLTYRTFQAFGSVGGSSATRISGTLVGGTGSALPNHTKPQNPYTGSFPGGAIGEAFDTGFYAIQCKVVCSFKGSMTYA